MRFGENSLKLHIFSWLAINCNYRFKKCEKSISKKFNLCLAIASEYVLLYVIFCTMRQYRDRRKPEAGTVAGKWFIIMSFHTRLTRVQQTLDVEPMLLYYWVGP